MDKDFNLIIKKYLSVVKQKYQDIQFAYLFGSYAKGKSTDDSDIDIALIFSHLEDSKRFEVQVQLMIIAADIDTRIEPHPFSIEDFNSGNPFVAEIKKTGVKMAS